MSTPLAHISDDRLRMQTLKEHAAGTADRAYQFAKSFGSENAAHALGMLHDVGKTSKAFQRRLNGANIRTDHSTAGAIEAYRLYRDPLLAACIAGHHAGLPDFGMKQNALFGDGTLYGRLKAEIGEEKDIEAKRKSCRQGKNMREGGKTIDPFLFSRTMYLWYKISCLHQAR